VTPAPLFFFHSLQSESRFLWSYDIVRLVLPRRRDVRVIVSSRDLLAVCATVTAIW
jgi:hypothetical protein